MALPALYNFRQVVSYIKVNLTPSTLGLSAGVPIGAAPRGAQIVDVVARKDTAFTGTSPTITLGTTPTGTDIATSADVDAATAGAKRSTTALAASFAADTQIYAKLGGTATAGALTVSIMFVADNDYTGTYPAS